MRSDAVCFQLQQNEVRFGGICLDIFPCGKLCEGFSSFGGNEGLCFLMELEIRKDMLTDKIRKAVYAPRVCVRFEAIQKCLIGGNAIAQTDAGAAKNLEVPRMTNRLSNSFTRGMEQISGRISENSI